MKTRGWKIEYGSLQSRAGIPLPGAARNGVRALPLRLCVSMMI
jgi:hypothetical protein